MMLTLAKFEEMLLRYGSSPDQWSEEFSKSAQSLLARDRKAKAMLEEFAAFEATLCDAAKVDPKGAALTGQILTQISARTERGYPAFTAIRPGILSACGGALALAMLGLGFYAGSLDLIWLDGANAGDLSQLLFGDPQGLMETL